MKIRNISAMMALTLLLAACATSQIKNYAAANKPLAEQGSIKWSTYYSGLYDEVAHSNDRNKGAMMNRVNQMIMNSQAFEAGMITKDQFQYLQRAAQAGQATDDEQDFRRRMTAAAAAMKTTTPVTTNCNTYGSQTNCITR